MIPSSVAHRWTTTYHHDGISAAIGKLNYLSQQAESGITTIPTLLLTTHMCARWEKNRSPIFYFVFRLNFLWIKNWSTGRARGYTLSLVKIWQHCRCRAAANNRNDWWPWKKGEKTMNVTFFTSIFQLIHYALTMHGWYVNTLTKLGTADAAVPLKKLNNGMSTRWEKIDLQFLFCYEIIFFNWMLTHRRHGW